MKGIAITFNSLDAIHDMKQVMKRYRLLPISLQRKYIRAAMREALKPWVPRFKAIAPVKSGALQRSVATITSFNGVSGSWYSRVGFTRNKKLVKRKVKGETQQVSRDGSHAILVFEGTATRRTRAGASRGSMPRNSEAAQAWRALAAQVRTTGSDVFVGSLRAKLDKAYAEAERRTKLKTQGRA